MNFIFKHRIALTLALLFIITLADFGGFLNIGPRNMHTWRQSDCVSLTYLYYEGNSFLEPEMHLQFGDEYTTGKSAGELPILYYAVGQLWKLTGPSYFVYRFIGLLILLLGVVSAYGSMRLLFPKSLIPEFFTLLIYSSPAYVYYSVSFLTDGPAISSVFIGLYFLALYAVHSNKKALVGMFFFFALAGGLKVSALMAPLFLLGVLFLETLGIKTLKNRSLFKDRGIIWLGYALMMGAIFSWYYYADGYNDLHRFKYTFNNIHPFWIIPEGKTSKILTDVGARMIPLYFNYIGAVLLALLPFITLFFFRKRIPLLASLASGIMSLGAVAYFLLWMPLMGIHDYYYAVLVILIPAIGIPFAMGMQAYRPEGLKSKTALIVLTGFFAYSVVYSVGVVRLKTGDSKSFTQYAIPTHVRDLLRWFNGDFKRVWAPLERLQPELENWGVDENTKIIAGPDDSFNRTLIYLNRKGWTSFIPFKDGKDVEKCIANGAEYLFVIKKHEEFLEPFLPYIETELPPFETVRIFRLKTNDSPAL